MLTLARPDEVQITDVKFGLITKFANVSFIVGDELPTLRKYKLTNIQARVDANSQQLGIYITEANVRIIHVPLSDVHYDTDHTLLLTVVLEGAASSPLIARKLVTRGEFYFIYY